MQNFFWILCLVACGSAQTDEPETTLSTQTEPAVVKTTPSSTAPVERRLFPQKFAASSHLENDWNRFQENYLAAYMGDDNPKTGWTEGKEDVGLGEWIQVEHTHLKDASKLRLKIRNGYQKTPRLFKRNARAKDITLTLIPNGQTSKHTLTDAEDWQEIETEQPAGPLHGYKITFDSVYAGTHYKDLVISDIQTFVTATTPDNPSFEKSKQARLLEWVKSRKEAAETFKKAAKGSIPIASSYSAEKTTKRSFPEKCRNSQRYSHCVSLEAVSNARSKWKDVKTPIADIQQAIESNFAGWEQVRVSSIDKRQIPQVDGLHVPRLQDRGWKHILAPAVGQLGFFNQKNLKRVHIENSPVAVSATLEAKTKACKQLRDYGDKDELYLYSPPKNASQNALLVVMCGTYEERDGEYTDSTWQLLHYNKSGLLDFVVQAGDVQRYHWVEKNGAPFLKGASGVVVGGRDLELTSK